MKQQMDDLKADLNTERERLQRDNQRLQDLLSEINLKRQAEVDSFRSEMAHMEEEAEANLDEVRRESTTLSHQVDRLQQVSHPPLRGCMGCEPDEVGETIICRSDSRARA